MRGRARSLCEVPQALWFFFTPPSRSKPPLPVWFRHRHHASATQPSPELPVPHGSAGHLHSHGERMLRALSASPSAQPGSVARRHPPCLPVPSMPAAAGAPQPRASALLRYAAGVQAACVTRSRAARRCHEAPGHTPTKGRSCCRSRGTFGASAGAATRTPPFWGGRKQELVVEGEFGK